MQNHHIYVPKERPAPALWVRITVTAIIATPILYGVIRGYAWSLPAVENWLKSL